MADIEPMYVPEGISQREIAAKSGVSVATVSRAVAGSPLVSARTRKQVQQAVSDLHRERARTLSAPTGRRVIGLTNSHLVQTSHPSEFTMLQEILGGVESAALAAGVSVYTFHQSGYLLDSGGADIIGGLGGLLLVGGVVSDVVIQEVLKRDIPTVLVGGHVPDSQLSSVAGDVSRGTYLMVQHLAALGHRRIAFVNGPSETYTSFERRAGFLEGLHDAALSMDEARILHEDGYTAFLEPAGYRLTQDILRDEIRPTGIIYASDRLAVGGMSAIREAGLRVPQDISVVGFDNSAVAEATSPRLTSVAVDRVEWGTRAFDRLLRLLDGEKSFAGDRLLLPVTIEVRESAAPVSG